MALQKEVQLGARNVLYDGQIEVRYDTIVIEDGVVIAGPSYHREVIHPGQDYSRFDPMIRRICAAEHTPEVIAAYQAARALREQREQVLPATDLATE